MKKLFLALCLLVPVSAFCSDSGIPQVVTSEVFTNSSRTVYYQPQNIHVYRGSTVKVTDYYDVYQPVVVYKKVGGYKTTRTCNVCR